MDRHAKAIMGDADESDGPTEGVTKNSGQDAGWGRDDITNVMRDFHQAVASGDHEAMAVHFKAAQKLATLPNNRDDDLDDTSPMSTDDVMDMPED